MASLPSFADHPAVIEKILTHLDAEMAEPDLTKRPPWRAVPQRGQFY